MERHPDETQYGEVVGLLTDLIRIDTSNPGRAERPAAEYAAERLAEAGLEPELIECSPGDPGRTAVVARFAGEDPSADALLIHGHLDVVPAAGRGLVGADPFAGEVRDGCVWGRGAVDMKDMDAMALAVVRRMVRDGPQAARATSCSPSSPTRRPAASTARMPRRQAPRAVRRLHRGDQRGRRLLRQISPELRLYLIQTAEKGIGWMRLQRPRTGRARLDDPRRQRRHPAGRGGVPDRAARVPDHVIPTPSGDFLIEVAEVAGAATSTPTNPRAPP